MQSIAYVHQELYGTDNLARVDLGHYARSLSVALQAALAPNARVTVDEAPVEVSIEVAVPCGLILNELLTNAFKHGRSPDGACVVSVVVRPEGGGFLLAVRDRGPGMDPALRASGTLGMEILRSLSRQLRARVNIERDEGASIRLEVPLPADA